MNRAMIKKIALTLMFSSLAAGATFAQDTAANDKCKKDKDVVCPAIFDPVVCDNGKTYSNQCFATADCATGCVPAGTTASATSTSAAAPGGGDILCLDIYDPVICNDGQVYGNACYARAAGAHGCKPYDA